MCGHVLVNFDNERRRVVRPGRGWGGAGWGSALGYVEPGSGLVHKLFPILKERTKSNSRATPQDLCCPSTSALSFQK